MLQPQQTNSFIRAKVIQSNPAFNTVKKNTWSKELGEIKIFYDKDQLPYYSNRIPFSLVLYCLAQYKKRIWKEKHNLKLIYHLKGSQIVKTILKMKKSQRTYTYWLQNLLQSPSYWNSVVWS